MWNITVSVDFEILLHLGWLILSPIFHHFVPPKKIDHYNCVQEWFIYESPYKENSNYFFYLTKFQFQFFFCKNYKFYALQRNMLALFTAKSLINESLLVYCIFEKSLVVARRRISSFVRWQNVCCDWRIMNGFGNFRAVRGKSYGEQQKQIYKFTLLQQTFMSPHGFSFIFHIFMWTWNVCILFRVHDDAIASWIEERSS